MVASSMTTAERFVPAPEPFQRGEWLLPRYTRDDVLGLVRLGIIPEDASTELLEGLVVLKDRSARGQDPTMIGQDHRRCVERFSSLRKVIDDNRRHVESQQPLVCSDTHVPEPDFMVLRGRLDDYRDLPTAADAFCVVEVADSSYGRDTGLKLRSYARAGVRQYVVVNLERRTAEVYMGPDPSAGTYPPPVVVADIGVLSLRVGEDELFPVPLRELLP